MTIWLLRFVPIGGGSILDARFKTEEGAREARSRARRESGPRVTIVDDFAIEFDVLVAQMSMILLNPPQSMASDKALHDANREAAKHAGILQEKPFGWPGSTVQ